MRYTAYPANWAEISQRIRFDRAKGRCEWCGLEEGQCYPRRKTRVRLAVAHLGVPKPDGRMGDKHDKSDCRPENLAALCQRCHLNYDRRDHADKASANRARKTRERLARLGYLQLEMAF